MTHDFKGTLEGIEWKMNDGSFTNAEKLAIISALQLAQEAEQLRKERDELARIILMVEDGSDLPVDEDEWNCIVRICREAKKVNENGNA